MQRRARTTDAPQGAEGRHRPEMRVGLRGVEVPVHDVGGRRRFGCDSLGKVAAAEAPDGALGLMTSVTEQGARRGVGIALGARQPEASRVRGLERERERGEVVVEADDLEPTRGARQRLRHAPRRDRVRRRAESHVEEHEARASGSRVRQSLTEPRRNDVELLRFDPRSGARMHDLAARDVAHRRRAALRDDDLAPHDAPKRVALCS